MKNFELLRKKILYRSMRRGTKEMDALLSNFVRKHINDFGIIELKQLDNLLQINDEILKKWYFQKNHKKLVPNNKVSLMFKKFKF